jgi:hypothetical protein
LGKLAFKGADLVLHDLKIYLRLRLECVRFECSATAVEADEGMYSLKATGRIADPDLQLLFNLATR